MRNAQVQTKRIGEASYEVLPLATGMSLKVLSRVLKMAAPAFADLKSMAEAASAVVALLSELAAGLDEDALAFVTAEFAKVTTVSIGDKKLPLGGERGIYEEHFRGDIMGLFEWLKFAAEVTYGPLFERLKAEAAPKPAAVPKPS